jgi:hypothetical protein
MTLRIPQSTSFELAFKAFLTTTGAEATGQTIAITISKKGATSFSVMNIGATNATEIANGWYFVTLDTTDTGTLGRLAVRGTSANINDVGVLLEVVSATTGGATNLDAAISTRMATYTQPTGFLSATFPSGTIANTTNITAGTITNVGTLTTYTGNTPQTGDAFARIGAGGAGLTALGDTRIANLDATVSSRSTFAGGAVASVTARVTANTDQLAGQTVTAAAGVTFPSSVASPTNITAGTITNVGTVTTVATVTNLTNAPTNGDLTAAMKASVTAAVPAAAQNATELLDQAAGVEANLTVRQQLRLAAAALYGKAAGLSTTTVTFRDTNDTVDRITATVDASGDRTAVTLNST